MKRVKTSRRIVSLALAILLGLTLLATSACAPGQAKNLEGVLQNIDSVSGNITIVTKDGKTMVISIDSKTQVTIDGTPVSIEALEPGARVEIKVEDDKTSTAGSIQVQLGLVQGTIKEVSGNKVTVQPGGGGQAVTVTVNSSTNIKLEGDRRGGVSDLKAGTRVEVKYNPQNNNALKVLVNTEETAELEGAITQVSGNSVTIQTEKGRNLTITISGSTQYEDGAKADLKAGAKVDVKFDPITMAALAIAFNKGGEDESQRGGNEESEEENGSTEAPPRIPHSIEGRADCLACHSSGENAVPADHAGRTSATCLSCHQPRQSWQSTII